MAPQATGPHKSGQNGVSRPLKRKRGLEDVNTLDKRVKAINIKEHAFETFAGLPLSQPTASGMEASHFKVLTDVQKQAIPSALLGSDILGAAKTGSGKTLAFLVPVLENLYRRKWTEYDGLGALILSPTRELAIQIFEVLRKIGRYHSFSAGLVIGGKSLRDERERLERMNILVCTPGRILQHMDQTASLDIGNLQMLVLDEADRIMDMGFQSTVDAIVEHLPQKRQTMLFSATQTKKVSDLARLSLKDPEYVSVHEAADNATPSTLQQNYIVTPLSQKLDTLWSFIRANLKSKIIVFLSSGKQVRFVYEAFRHMQPGLPLMHLHGRQKQTTRLDITNNYSASKHSCLFATDVVARGLDFPAVDWVIQLDCPEDADTYIHRVGRTARYEREGRAVLFLEPSEEEGMLKRLEQKRVTVEKINVRQKKQQSIQNQLQNMCFKDPELKYLGQKAFVSYVRSVHLQKDKEVFKLSDLPLEDFSASLGLPGTPSIRFGKGDAMKTLKNAPRSVRLSSDDEDDSDGNQDLKAKSKADQPRTKYDRMFERTNQDVLANHFTKLVGDGEGSRDDGEDDLDGRAGFLSVKRRLSSASEDEVEPRAAENTNDIVQDPDSKIMSSITKEPILVDSKRKEKLLKSKKNVAKLKEKGKKLIFDEDGTAHEMYELQDEDKFQARGAPDEQKAKFFQAEQERLRSADVSDKAAEKAKRREKKAKKKAREALEVEPKEAPQVELVPFEGDGGDAEPLDDMYMDDESAGEVKERPKKWFEKGIASDALSRRNKGDKETHKPETLEDLEAMASGLLA